MTAAKEKAKAVSAEFDENAGVSEVPEGWEFDTAIEESGIKVVFDTIGDTFVGRFEGIEHVEPDNGKDDPFDMLTFTGRDGQKYSVNSSYKLAEMAAKVQPGTWCRLVYTKDVPSSKGNPMKDIRVDVRR